MCEDSEDSLMEEDESEWDADAPPVDQTAARAAAKAAAEKALPECKIDALQNGSCHVDGSCLIRLMGLQPSLHRHRISRHAAQPFT